VKFLIDQEFATLDTHTSKNIEDDRKELDIVDWTGKTIMTEVTRAVVIC
jgi:hypothetical protein